MSLEILKPGLLTTIQDTGRYGHQKEGIVVGGAMDTIALRIANLLAGNKETAAALEITQTGPKIQFTQNHLIALAGADLSATLNGEPLRMYRPVHVPMGSILEFGAPVLGCRAYLAVAGGLDVPKVLGSYATYLRAGFGGLEGRALQAGDILRVKKCISGKYTFLDGMKEELMDVMQAPWSIVPKLYPAYTNSPTIRVLKGPEYDLFSEESKDSFWNNKFKVSPQSDRMGYRLQGNKLALKEPAEMLSSSVTFGTIQVPPEGNPIVLMADRQTTGGYPRLAQVISADLPILAQVAPGHNLKFEETTLELAHTQYIRQEQLIEKIKQTLQLKQSKAG